MAKNFIADRQINLNENKDKLVNPYCLETAHESKWVAFHEDAFYELDDLKQWGGKYVGGEEVEISPGVFALTGGKMVFGKESLDDPTRESYNRQRLTIEANALIEDAEKHASNKRAQAAALLTEADALEVKAVEDAEKMTDSISDEDKKVAAKAAKAAK